MADSDTTQQVTSQKVESHTTKNPKQVAAGKTVAEKNETCPRGAEKGFR